MLMNPMEFMVRPHFLFRNEMLIMKGNAFISNGISWHNGQVQWTFSYSLAAISIIKANENNVHIWAQINVKQRLTFQALIQSLAISNMRWFSVSILCTIYESFKNGFYFVCAHFRQTANGNQTHIHHRPQYGIRFQYSLFPLYLWLCSCLIDISNNK